MRDIPGYEGLYAATSCGRIWSYRRNKFMTSCGGNDNYQIVTLCKDGEAGSYYVHRLVALAFLDNSEMFPEVDHINRKKDDNRLSNLRWVSRVTNRANRVFTKPKGRPKKVKVS